MKSENKVSEKEQFEPRSVEQSKLYSDNVRLQRLCYLHRKHIRQMQSKLHLLRVEARELKMILMSVCPEVTAEGEMENDAAN